MTEIRYLVGDVFEQMATLPDGSIDLIMTSPPFLALRSYLPDDHPDKAKEIGSEPDPATFVDTLLRLSAEWRRLLAPHGTICVELGDTYSGSGGAGGDYNDGGLREGQNAFSGSAAKRAANGVGDDYRPSRAGRGDGWPEAKCKAMIPELYRIALGYGIHPLTGEQSPAGRWKVRNVITWCRPNPPVGALGDKFRPATSDMVIACTSKDRWFDLDAVRGPISPNTHTRVAKGAKGRTDLASQQRDGNWNTLAQVDSDPAVGAPPLDYWVIPPGGTSIAHFAVYPPELCVKPIQAMCPRHVCRQCGQPRRRITESEPSPHAEEDRQIMRLNNRQGPPPGPRTTRTTETLGWTDCGHDNYRAGRVLDPFAGSFTTGMVAHGLGRDCIGIDIDARNVELARGRLGMFLIEGDAA